MKITVLGTGYVGLVVGTCFSDLGNEVTCLDIDEEKIENLKKGKIPIYEPGLEEMVKRNKSEGRLRFSTSLKEGIESGEVLFIAVGTPTKEDGGADLKYVKTVAADIGKFMNEYKIVVDKSTVPVGTADMVSKIIKENQKENIDFDVVSNPEFLKEGSAVKDFQNPDRVVIGVDSKRAEEKMKSLYKPLERANRPIIVTDPRTAEVIKYASNSFLATKISFINEMANFCERVGADVTDVAKGMGLDGRIGPRFLHAGIGYGGSCFPKDVKALIKTGKENGYDFKIVTAAHKVNEKQKRMVLPKLNQMFESLEGKKIALLGLSFKPKTDDIRKAPSLVLVKQLQDENAKIKAFDPEAIDNMKRLDWVENVEFGKNPYDTVEGCDCLVILTEWDVFRELDKKRIKSLLKNPNVVDGRNIYDPEEMKELGFNYIGVGRGK